jgi:hypothetical protein
MSDTMKTITWILAAGCVIGASALCCCKFKAQNQTGCQAWSETMRERAAEYNRFDNSPEGCRAHTEREVAAGRVGVGAFEMSRHTSDTYASRND